MFVVVSATLEKIHAKLSIRGHTERIYAMFKSSHPSESYSLRECFIIMEMFELRQLNSHFQTYHVQIHLRSRRRSSRLRPIRLCIIVNNFQMDHVHIHLGARWKSLACQRRATSGQALGEGLCADLEFWRVTDVGIPSLHIQAGSGTTDCNEYNSTCRC